MTEEAFVELATVLRGAQPLAEKGINDSYRGQLVLSDGTTRSAILKDLDERQLANELLAAALAHALGMPVPKAHLAIVPSGDILAVQKGPVSANGERLVFASADVATPSVSQLYVGRDPDIKVKVCRRIAEWDLVGDLFGFDAWVANIDRHEGNLLFAGNNQLWIIDHGHCFTGPKWAVTDLVAEKSYSSRLRRWLTPVMSEDQRKKALASASLLEGKISVINLKSLVKLNHIQLMLESSDFDALVNFLSDRTPFVPKLAAEALNENWAV